MTACCLASSGKPLSDTTYENVEVETSISERVRNALRRSNLRPGQNYVERDFFYVVLNFLVGDNLEQHEAIIGRASLRQDRSRMTFDESLEVTTVWNGRYFEDVLFVAEEESTDEPEWISSAFPLRPLAEKPQADLKVA
ncbi:MAG TPA: hypothetical protein VHW69_14895 [Rhizomicrobium sp.]|nr:hypothetical protein [Rhizomicrobium sp.]